MIWYGQVNRMGEEKATEEYCGSREMENIHNRNDKRKRIRS